MVEYSSVKLVTVKPLMAKFWLVPLIVIRRRVTLVALFRYTPMPDVTLPSAPLLFAIVPPVPLPPNEVLTPSPFTAKLPLVLLRDIPSFVPPEDETLVSEIASGVVALLRVILTAAPLPELIAPLVVVMVLVFSVAFKPVWFEVVLLMFSAAKLIVPALLVRLTPLLPELVTLVVPAKLNVAPLLPRLIPELVEVLTVVVPVTNMLPAAEFTVIPALVLLVELTLWKIASSVPLLRFSACPVPLLIVVSRTL